DVPGNGEAYLTSDLSLSHATDKVSTYVAARRFRNLMTPLDQDPREFDSDMVQVFPQAELATNDKLFFGNAVAGGLSLSATNFQRTASFYDRDQFNPVTDPTYRPGVDPLREATRAQIHPSLYTTFRPGDVVSLVPRANYYHYLYDFHGKGDVPSLSRGYLHLDMDISIQLERVYDRSPKSEFPKV